jgi:hypothetical protein
MVEQSSFQSDKIIQQGQSPEAIEKSGLVVLLARPRATRNCGRKSNFDKAQGLHTTVGDHLQAPERARLQRHRVEAPWLQLSTWPRRLVVQDHIQQ